MNANVYVNHLQLPKNKVSKETFSNFPFYRLLVQLNLAIQRINVFIRVHAPLLAQKGQKAPAEPAQPWPLHHQYAGLARFQGKASGHGGQ